MRRLIDANALTERVTGNGLKPITEQIFCKLVGDTPTVQTKEVKYFDEDENVWKIGSVIVE